MTHDLECPEILLFLTFRPHIAASHPATKEKLLRLAKAQIAGRNPSDTSEGQSLGNKKATFAAFLYCMYFSETKMFSGIKRNFN
jgi:hypothetical protein